MIRALLALTLFTAAAHAADSPQDLERRLRQYQQMYYELEFSAEPEELEYLQRKIKRLELELETARITGSCKSYLEMN